MRNPRRLAAVTAVAIVVGLLSAVGMIGMLPSPAPAGERAVAARADTSAYGKRVLALTNKQRRAHHCPALHWQTQLRRSAQLHTNLMAATDLLSHLLSNELGLVARILKVGYHPWRRLAENIAVGYPTPSTVVKAWMHSPEHRRNILDCHLHDLGVGVKQDASGTVWWTQDFGQH